jgi:hypothetical protein
VGPWATVSLGIAFQRKALKSDAPQGAERAGWVGDSRFSIGAVRSQPFSEVPTLTVHLTDQIDIIALFRLDVNTGIDTSDSRFLFGVEIAR